MKKIERKGFGKNKLLIIVTILLISSAVIGTIAYLFNYYNKINAFEVGFVKTEIVENVNSNEGDTNSDNSNTNSDDSGINPSSSEMYSNDSDRNNVAIKNIGNVPIYVRASVLMYFENNEGQIISDKPVEDTDYSITYSNFSDSNWVLSEDGYYYYKAPVQPNENTGVLIESFVSNVQYENKKLILDIVTQSIQAEPIKAIQEAWGVSIENLYFINL